MTTTASSSPRWRMPAEWEPHRATWIAWPHFEPDWPGKLAPIPWVYGEIARVLADFEPVEILCHSEPVYENAGAILESHAVRADHIRLHLVPNDRTWLRDSAPTGVVDPDGAVTLLNWSFNAWAKYANWRVDAQVGREIAAIAQLPRVEPSRPDNGAPMVLEGGGIETNGAGLLLVTEEWLLSGVQVRHAGLTRDGYEQAFAEWLGTRKTIWLGEAVRATTPTGTSTTSRGSSRPTPSCSRSRKIRRTRITRDRWTTSGGWSSRHRIPKSVR